MEKKLVRIVPPSMKDGVVPTTGTKVYVGDEMLQGVTKVIIKGEVNSVWEAEIHCQVQMQPMDAVAVIHYPAPWWRRLINLIVGPGDGLRT